jgi:hypothetical protein
MKLQWNLLPKLRLSRTQCGWVDWNFYSLGSSTILMSTPAGCGLKLHFYLPARNYCVAPHAGVVDCNQTPYKGTTEYKSRTPCGVGLKLSNINLKQFWTVLTHAGVWLKPLKNILKPTWQFAPHAGVWIETRNYIEICGTDRSHPCGVWIETHYNKNGGVS